MLLLGMLTGGIFHELFAPLGFLTPWLIFFMLLFTFSNLSPKAINLKPAHFILLAIQLVAGILAYYLVVQYDPLLAQGALICFLAPTATSAAVITGMLNGSIAFLTSFTLLSNIGVAIVAPLFFSTLGVNPEYSFLTSFWVIFLKVFPLLMLPLFLAWGIRYKLPRIQRKMLQWSSVPFYLWAFSLVIVTARTVNSLVHLEQHDYKTELSFAVISLLFCSVQFYIGRRIGARYGDKISGGQSLGQKNTIFAIWMAQTFLNPMAALAPSTYLVWQNMINSYQLYQKRKQPDQ